MCAIIHRIHVGGHVCLPLFRSIVSLWTQFWQRAARLNLKLTLDCELLTFVTGLTLPPPDIMIINEKWHMSQMQHSRAVDCLDQLWHLTLNKTFLSAKHMNANTRTVRLSKHFPTKIWAQGMASCYHFNSMWHYFPVAVSLPGSDLLH